MTIHVISKRVTFTCIDSNGALDGPVPVRLLWDSADPLVVLVGFNPDSDEPVTWRVSRDLLTEGLHGQFGAGDIRVQRLGSRVGIGLANKNGRAVFTVPRDDLWWFLDATLEIVPAGEELATVDVDAELAAWLGQEGAAA